MLRAYIHKKRLIRLLKADLDELHVTLETMVNEQRTAFECQPVLTGIDALKTQIDLVKHTAATDVESYGLLRHFSADVDRSIINSRVPQPLPLPSPPEEPVRDSAPEPRATTEEVNDGYGSVSAPQPEPAIVRLTMPVTLPRYTTGQGKVVTNIVIAPEAAPGSDVHGKLYWRR